MTAALSVRAAPRPYRRAISPAMLDTLRAMVSREAPLIACRSTAFVRGWNPPVVRATVTGLVARRLIAPTHTTREATVFDLTVAGRSIALEACSPETRDRLAAARLDA